MAIVTFRPNPLTPNLSKITKSYDYVLTLKEVFEDLEIGEANFIIKINDETPDSVHLDQTLKESDIINIDIVLGNSEDAQKIISGVSVVVGIVLVATSVGAGIGASLIVGGASGLVSSLINRQSQEADASEISPAERRTVAASPNFSLSAATNPVRRLESLPLCLSGRGHRFYPDFSSNPYSGNQFRRTTTYTGFKWGEGVDPNPNDLIATALHTQLIYKTTQASINAGNTDQFGNSLYEALPVSSFNYNDYPFSVDATINPESTDFPQYIYNVRSVTNQTYPTDYDENFSNVIDRTVRLEDINPISHSRVQVPNIVCFNDPNDPNFGRWTLLETFRDFVLFDIPFTATNPNDSIRVNVEFLSNIETLDQNGNSMPAQESQIVHNFYEQKLYHVFNFGFGDCDIFDHRFINTDLPSDEQTNTSLLSAKIHEPTKQQNDWPLLPRPSNFIPQSILQSLGDNWERGINIDRCPFTDVDTVSGGLLVNQFGDDERGSFQGPQVPVTNDQNYNWINREGPENVFMIEADLQGELFRSDQIIGITNNDVEIQLQYRLRSGGAWTDFLGFTPSRNIRWADSNNFMFTATTGLIPEGNWEFRARRVTPEQNDSQDRSRIEISAVRFFQVDNSINTGENRRAVTVVANGQVNGALDRYSAIIRNKCWSYQRQTDSFIWDYSSNPADLFLYFIRGGYYNEDADGSFQFPFSPTFGWVNHSEHPSNGERMFGAGISEKRIDFDSLKQWHIFCEDRDLTFDTVLQERNTCFDIIQAISAAGRASPSFHTGRLGVIIEDESAPISASFGMHNIIKGSFNVSYQNDNLSDEIIVQYIDRDSEWETREVRATMPQTEIGINPTRISILGITDRKNAQREANLQAARQYYQRRLISFQTDLEGLCVNRGDVIRIQHDMTQWDYSARMQMVVIEDGLIKGFTIDCEVPDSINYAAIKNPNGDVEQVSVSIIGNKINVLDDLPASFGPSITDQSGNENALSNSDICTVPEDFMILLGPFNTQGKKARITQLQPVDNNTVEITCTDEESAMYAREFDKCPNDLPFLDPAEATRPLARIFNVCVTQLGDGVVNVIWDSEGTFGTELFSKVGNMPESQVFSDSGASFFGNTADLQFGGSDRVTLRFEPFIIGQPFEVETESITFVVD